MDGVGAHTPGDVDYEDFTTQARAWRDSDVGREGERWQGMHVSC